MKRKWIETGRDLLVILNNHIMLVSFCVTAMGLFKQNDHMLWLWFVLLFIPIMFYLVRAKIHNFFVFFILHFAVPIGFIFVPIHIWTRFLVLFISIVYSAWSIKLRFKRIGQGESVLEPLFMTGALGFMLILENAFCHKGWDGIYIALAIIYVAGYCMYTFLKHYIKFLYVNESSAANIPEAEIFGKGFSQSFVYIIGMVLFLGLTANVELLSSIVSWIGNILLGILKYLLSKAGGAQEQESIMTPTEKKPLNMMDIFQEPEQTSFLGEFLEKLFINILMLCVIALVLFGIVKGFQYLWKKFHESSIKEEDEIEEGIDVRETCEIEKNQKVGQHWSLFFSNRDKIRKIYRKQVLKNQTTIIGDLDAQYLEYMTAKECCDTFAAEQLKRMYEKVRYSAEDITSDDVRTAKSGVK